MQSPTLIIDFLNLNHFCPNQSSVICLILRCLVKICRAASGYCATNIVKFQNKSHDECECCLHLYYSNRLY